MTSSRLASVASTRRAARVAAFAAALLGLALPSLAAQVTVGSGASVDLGTGLLDLGCADLHVTGTLSAGSVGFDAARNVTIDPTGLVNGDTGVLQMTGDWGNAGSFAAGESTVSFVDGCGVASAVIGGNTTFSGLDMTTTSGKLYRFVTGSEQTVTQSLVLTGTTNDLLGLRSTLDGSAASLNVTGSQSVDFIDVQDIHATGDPIHAGSNSVVGSNTTGITVPEPSAVLLQAVVLAALSLLARGRPRRAARR